MVSLEKPGTPEELVHFGVKGMQWGVRKEVHPAIAHIPKKIRKEAAADAEEFTRAKLYFGEGAGTRRKLINAKVESKKAKDKLYAKAFDHFVKQTDLGQRAIQARQQRRRKDTGKRAKKLGKMASPFLTNLLVNDLAPHSYGDRTRRFNLDHSNTPVTQSELFVDEFLAHFGVKGMQWGVRKQIDESKAGKFVSKKKEQRAEKREGKAKYNEAQASRAQSHIDQIQANPSRVFFVQAHREHQVKELEKFRDQRLKDAKDIREGHLTTHQKHVLIGAGAVAAVLVAYGTYKAVDSGKARQLLTKNVPLKKNELLSRKMSHDAIMKEVVAPINPNYGELGTKMNCRRATIAYDQRRRGFDVKATKSVAGTGQTPTSLLNAIDPNANMPTTKGGTLVRLVKEATAQSKDPTRDPRQVAPMMTFMQSGGLGKTPVGKDFAFGTPAEKSKEIFGVLKTHPEGARGELGVKWAHGGAHSMAWEIINGKPVIIDTQTATSYTQAKFTKEVAESVHQAGVTRLDNLPMNQAFLRKWITNVK